MTTKVTIACQEDSHWDLKVITQDLVKRQWLSNPNADIILGPGESTEAHRLYVHDSRRYIVEEKVRT